MQVRAGYTITLDTAGPTPMNLQLNVRPERESDLLTPMVIRFEPPVPVTQHLDDFGNLVTRLVAPAGRIGMAADFMNGYPDSSVEFRFAGEP